MFFVGLFKFGSRWNLAFPQIQLDKILARFGEKCDVIWQCMWNDNNEVQLIQNLLSTLKETDSLKEY